MYIGIKILIAFVVLAATLQGGLPPLLIRINEKTQRLLFYGETFSGGIFLGVGLIHLLPEAQSYLNHSTSSYPLAFAICAFTILVLYVIEEGAYKLISPASHESWMVYLLIIVLSIHSFVEGTALGVEVTLPSLLVIFIAIISHKSAEAFALGVKLRHSKMNRVVTIKAMCLFSLITPLGIFLGAELIHVLHQTAGYMAIGVFDAIAAGTFIYIATFHSSSSHVHENDHTVSVFLKVSAFALGLVLMAIVAFWI
ncbi:MAG: hypothetical protein A3C55_01280 [Gammaproteobacteria bacterium RIFCSPHIGHO2_02_FULL_42_13]|nr:MAG: hypothetical protein A3C55_01280 [Gammaproteobacteria bacterium RIFCSPHIGHO2_02_FULL_42_13]OGT68774.1 MAG: hypothetical protein A3H43_03935 [Gammaproteobacteria bacterium RIFCSPLOWO2_02_FULL_42_9]